MTIDHPNQAGRRLHDAAEALIEALPPYPSRELRRAAFLLAASAATYEAETGAQ